MFYLSNALASELLENLDKYRDYYLLFKITMNDHPSFIHKVIFLSHFIIFRVEINT